MKLQVRNRTNADLDDEQPCPECDGRGEDDCLTCGGEGYI